MWQVTCPLHRLGPLVESLPRGHAVFRGITAAKALSMLRTMLEALGVEKWYEYRTHDLRRGHAQDLVDAGWNAAPTGHLSALARLPTGAPLYQILAAGEWSSPAFLAYIDDHKLETELVVQAHLDEELPDEEE